MNKKTLVEILDTKRPSNLQDATLQSLRLAFGKFEDNGFKTVYDSNKIIDPVTKTEFATIEDLKNFLFKFDIPKDIPNKYFGILIEHWYENTTPEQIYSEPTLTKTTLDKDESAQLIAEADKRNKEIADIRESSDKRVQDALRQKQKLIDQRLEQELENKKIKVVATQEIHQGKLTDTDAKEIFDLAKAAKEDPAAVVEAISNRVYASIATAPIEIREAVTKPVIEKSVTSLVEKLEALPVYESMADIPKIFPAFNTVSPLTAFMILNDAKLKGLIHDDEIRAYFVERVQALSLTMEAERTVNTSVTDVIGSENFTEFFYGFSEPTNFEIADDQNNEDSMEVSLDDINKYGRDAYKYLNKIKTAKGAVEVTTTSTPIYTPYAYLNSPATTAKTVSLVTKALPVVGAVYGFKQGVLLSQWARGGQPLLSSGNQQLVKMLMSQNGIQNISSASGFIYSKPLTFQFGKFQSFIITASNPTKGVQLAAGGVKFGEKWAGLQVAKKGTQAVVQTATSQAGTKLAVGATSTLTKALTFLGGLSSWATAGLSLIGGYLLGKIIEKVNWEKVKKFFSEFVLPVTVGGGLAMFGAPVAGLVVGGMLFGVARGATLASMTAGTLGVLGFIGSSIGIAIATPVIISIIVIPPLIAFIMLVINNSAYVVPPKIVGTDIINIPPGGNLTRCDPTKTGDDITQQLASSIQSGSVQLLPNSSGSRQEGLCMTPTMIILHTSGGYDNDDGNTRTYETLVSRNVSCQLSTDTNDTILMLNFFEKQVENAWCADNLNAGGVSIEMAGECQGSGCAQVSKCSPNTNLTFTPNGPHPCAPLEDLSFDAICKVMQQYKIPWTQVFQHEASNGTHTDPIGDEWSDKFILRLKNSCQI